MCVVLLSHHSLFQAAKYHTSTVPFPMKTKEVFEQSLRMPIGREYNGEKVFRDMIRPAVSCILFVMCLNQWLNHHLHLIYTCNYDCESMRTTSFLLRLPVDILIKSFLSL